MSDTSSNVGHRTGLPDAAEQVESVQVYVAICECNAVLVSGSPATREFPVASLSCRECYAEVPAHLVTLPFRGLSQTERWRRLAIAAIDRAEMAVHGEADSADDLRARAIALGQRHPPEAKP